MTTVKMRTKLCLTKYEHDSQQGKNKAWYKDKIRVNFWNWFYTRNKTKIQTYINDNLQVFCGQTGFNNSDQYQAYV